MSIGSAGAEGTTEGRGIERRVSRCRSDLCSCAIDCREGEGREEQRAVGLCEGHSKCEEMVWAAAGGGKCCLFSVFGGTNSLPIRILKGSGTLMQ